MILIWCIIAPLIAEDIAVHREELVLNCNMPDTEDNTVFDNQDEEAAAMNEFPSAVGVNLGTFFWSLLFQSCLNWKNCLNHFVFNKKLKTKHTLIRYTEYKVCLLPTSSRLL